MKKKIKFSTLLTAVLSVALSCYGEGARGDGFGGWDRGASFDKNREKTGRGAGQGKDIGRPGRGAGQGKDVGRPSRGAGQGKDVGRPSRGKYEDIQEFVDKYVRDDIKDKLNGFKGEWGFSDVKFTNVKSQTLTLRGTFMEKITCDVTFVPVNGVRHYIPVSWTVADDEDNGKLSDMLKGRIPSDVVPADVVSAKWLDSTSRRADTLRTSLGGRRESNSVKVPVGVPMAKSDYAGMFSVTVYRAKDGEGVYRPVKANGISEELVGYKPNRRCSFVSGRSGSPFGNSLLTEGKFKELGGVSSAGKGVGGAIRKASDAHSRAFAEAYADFVKLADEYRTVSREESGRRSADRRLHEARLQKLKPAKEESERIIGEAHKRLARAKNAIYAKNNAVKKAMTRRNTCKKRLESAENKLAQAEEAMAKNAVSLENARKTKPKGSRAVNMAARVLRQSEDDVKKCRSKVQSERQKLKAAEEKIAEAEREVKNNLAEQKEAAAALKKTKEEQAAIVKALSERIERDVMSPQNNDKKRCLEAGMKSAARRMDAAWNEISKHVR